MSGRTGLAAAVAYVVVTFLSFPHPVGGGVLDLGLALSWLSPLLLLLAIRGLAPRAAAWRGFLCVWLAHTAILHWIYVVTVSYGHASPLIGVFAPALLASYIGLFGAAFGTLMARFEGQGLASPFAAAALWTVLDHGRSWLFTGFPWATLGYAQHDNGPLLGLASYTGVYGLSFVTVLGGAALLEAGLSLRARERPRIVVLAALATVVAAHGLGALAPDPDAQPRPTVPVAVVQGNVDQGEKWSPGRMQDTLERYEALTREAAAAGAKVIVWPETAVPGAVDVDGALRQRIRDLARDTGAWLVVGAVGLEFDGQPRPARYYDSAFTVDPTGEFRERYDKTHLVPFGEYLPFQDLLGTFLRAVASGVAPTGVSPGPAPRALTLALPSHPELQVGVPICYELLFPDLVRRFAADGAQVLFGITNDAWYGRTGAPYQFYAITALRAAESRLWIARAANTGVSGFIDARGRVRQATPIFESAYRVEDVPLHARPREASFYVRHGDAFVGLCWLSVAAFEALRWLRARGGRMRDAPRPERRGSGHE